MITWLMGSLVMFLVSQLKAQEVREEEAMVEGEA